MNKTSNQGHDRVEYPREEIEELRAEVEAMRAVVEAARQYHIACNVVFAARPVRSFATIEWGAKLSGALDALDKHVQDCELGDLQRLIDAPTPAEPSGDK